MKIFLIIAAIGVVLLLILILVIVNIQKLTNDKKTYQRAKSFAIGQDLYSSIAKQKLLSSFAKDGQLTEKIYT